MEHMSQSAVSKRSDLQPQTYSLAEAAAVLGVSYTVLHQLVIEDRSPVKPFKIGRQWKFSRAAIDALLGVSGTADTERP